MFKVEGSGCVILECSEEVLLGMMRLLSPWLVDGRSPVRGRRLNEGAMVNIAGSYSVVFKSNGLPVK